MNTEVALMRELALETLDSRFRGNDEKNCGNDEVKDAGMIERTAGMMNGPRG